MSTPPPAVAWRLELEALLEKLKREKASLRLLLYLDLRSGEVVEGGEVRPHAEKWVP